MFRFYGHLYLKAGLGPVLGPFFGLCTGPILVQIVVNDITVSQMSNSSPLNQYISCSEPVCTEFPSKNVKFGHFWANGPPFWPRWDPLGRVLKSKCVLKFQGRLVSCHKVSHLGFYIHLVLNFCGKLQKTLISLYFPYISIVKYP